MRSTCKYWNCNKSFHLRSLRPKKLPTLQHKRTMNLRWWASGQKLPNQPVDGWTWYIFTACYWAGWAALGYVQRKKGCSLHGNTTCRANVELMTGRCRIVGRMSIWRYCSTWAKTCWDTHTSNEQTQLSNNYFLFAKMILSLTIHWYTSFCRSSLTCFNALLILSRLIDLCYSKNKN